MVRRSKLEINLDILKILAYQGPVELARLSHKIGLSQNILRQHLDFLAQQNLVEQQKFGKTEVFYVITERGLRVLNVVVPIVTEALKIPAFLY